jgi:hypothetical protein
MIPVGYVVTAVACFILGATWACLIIVHKVLPETIKQLCEEGCLLLVSRAKRDAERQASDSTRNVSGGMRGC